MKDNVLYLSRCIRIRMRAYLAGNVVQIAGRLIVELAVPYARIAARKLRMRNLEEEWRQLLHTLAIQRPASAPADPLHVHIASFRPSSLPLASVQLPSIVGFWIVPGGAAPRVSSTVPGRHRSCPSGRAA